MGDRQSIEYDRNLLESLWNALNDHTMTTKGSNGVESALRFIFKDWYNIYYTVKSGHDKIDEMSPGKKALVLLELLINLQETHCPILIDQPEDDLDNRSIYDDLVQFIRKKKLERQIIVVTHNANVVLGADAEDVIIANQAGKDAENAQYRFEYRTGAIENDAPVFDSDRNIIHGVLNQTGLQTQICDILEGGRIAFELRQNKYTSAKH